jgi:hypothetical protein
MSDLETDDGGLRFSARSGSDVSMTSRFALSAITVAIAAALGLGCAPEPMTKSDGGGGSGGTGGGGVTYTKDIKPLFMAKCAPCHTTDGLGAHNIGTTYADVNKPVQSVDAPAGCFKDGFDKTMPKTMGECALAAIMEGWMPMAMFCFNTPRPAGCVTLAEQDLVAAWVAAGMPE